MIGLGGAEFRLPVLVAVLGYAPHAAVPINLTVSFVTLLTAVATRWIAGAIPEVAPFLLEIASLTTGAVVFAYLGSGVLHRLSRQALSRTILVLLLGIGLLLIVEGLTGAITGPWVAGSTLARCMVGVGLGVGVGLVSSLLGVAGGELLIPIFVYAFGAPIKTAGMAGMLVSIPTVATGLWRYYRIGSLSLASVALLGLMALGSIIGAVGGAAMAPYAPAEGLKIGLGLILIWSAWRAFREA